MPEATQDRLARMRELMRQNPPTALGSSAMMRGPGGEAALEGSNQQQAAQASMGQAPDAYAGLRAGAEILATTAASAVPGGMLASRFGSGMVSTVGKLGAKLLGRALPAAVAGIAASEAFTPDELESEEDAWDRRAAAGATAVVGEALGMAAHPVLRKLLTPVRRRLGGVTGTELVDEGAAEGQAMLRARGVSMTPGEMRKGSLLDTFENTLEASFLSKETFRVSRGRADVAALEAFKSSIPGYIESITPKQAGELLDDIFKGAVKFDKKVTRAAYKALDQELSVSRFGTDKVLDMGRIYSKYSKELEHAVDAGDPHAIRILKLLKGGQAGEGGPSIPVEFRKAESIRSYLLSMSRQTQGDVLPDIRSLAGRVAGEVDEMMVARMTSFGAEGGRLIELSSAARAASKLGHKTYDNELIVPLLSRAAPEDVAKSLLSVENPSQIRAVKELIFSPRFRGEIPDPMKTWRGLQSSYLGGMMSDAGAGEFGKVSGSQLMGALRKAGGTAAEMFSMGELKSLRVAARAMELIQQGSGGGSGPIWIQLMQAGVAGGLLGFGPGDMGDRAKAAGVIILGPAALSLAFTSPRFSSWMLHRALTKGARIGQRSSDLVAQAMSHLTADKIAFTYRDTDGKDTVYDPSTSPSNPTSQKPQSKF